MLQYKEVKISKIFDILGEGSNLTKKFIEENKGDFPVYSGKTKDNGVYGYIDQYKYSESLLTWSTYGVHAGTIFVREGKFNIGRNSCGLKPKNEFKKNIYIEYIKYVCEIYFKFNAQGGIGEHRRLPQQIVKDILIKLPIKNNGEFDLNKQKEIANKYVKIEKAKDRIRIMKEDIENQGIEIGDIGQSSEIKLDNLFDLSINTNNSQFTKSFVNDNKGNIPVYSASKSPILVGYGYVKDGLSGVKYFQNCLTWNIDGSIGKAFYREGKFTLSEKVIPLVLFDKYDDIDVNYIKYILEIQIKKEGFGFTKKAGKGRMKYIMLKIPIKKDGKFDLEKQKEISNKYEKIEKVKNNLIQELEDLEKVKVEIS